MDSKKSDRRGKKPANTKTKTWRRETDPKMRALKVLLLRFGTGNEGVETVSFCRHIVFLFSLFFLIEIPILKSWKKTKILDSFHYFF